MSLISFLVLCHLRPLAPLHLVAGRSGHRRRAAGAGPLEAGAAGARARARRPSLPLRGAVAREGGGGTVVQLSAVPWVCPGARPRPAPPGRLRSMARGGGGKRPGGR